jgi:hypothetical protein
MKKIKYFSDKHHLNRKTCKRRGGNEGATMSA